MKYKVGDKVKVRSDLVVGKEYGTDGFVHGMRSKLGHIVEISRVLDDSKKYYIKDFPWAWTDEMFEGLEDGKMYASELMELARKEPEKYEGKKYKASGDVILKRTGDRADTDIITFKYGCPIVEGYATAFMSARTELEEIKPEPKLVPLKEAAEAYSQGKEVESKVRGMIRKYRDFFGKSIYNEFKDVNGLAPSVDEILNGEWFIKE